MEEAQAAVAGLAAFARLATAEVAQHVRTAARGAGGIRAHRPQPLLPRNSPPQEVLQRGVAGAKLLRRERVAVRDLLLEHRGRHFRRILAAALACGDPLPQLFEPRFAEPDVIARLEANRQVVFRYTTPTGEVTDEANPNGSAAAIAGLCNESRNVVGLMPHPERACEPLLGSGDGLVVLESVVHSLKSGALVART